MSKPCEHLNQGYCPECKLDETLTDKEALIQEIEKLSTVALRYASDYEEGFAAGKNETIDDVINIIRGVK